MDAICFVFSRYRKLVSPVCQNLIAFLKAEVISFQKKESRECNADRTAAKIRQIKNRYLSGCSNQIFHALLLSPSPYMNRGDPDYWYSKPEKVNKYA